MDQLDSRTLERDWEQARPYVRESVNGAIRHILTLEEFVRNFNHDGIERCRDHAKRIENVEKKSENGYGKSLMRMNLGQWLVLVVVLCGIVATYTKNVSSLDNVSVQMIKIDKQLTTISEKIDRNNNRITTIEAKITP